MKFFTFTFIFITAIFFPIALFSNNDSPQLTETTLLENLIEETTKKLQSQKKLLELLVEYQKNQSLYMQNSQNNMALYRMIKIAHVAVEIIKENDLTYLFDAKFLSELSLCSKALSKPAAPAEKQ